MELVIQCYTLCDKRGSQSPQNKNISKVSIRQSHFRPYIHQLLAHFLHAKLHMVGKWWRVKLVLRIRLRPFYSSIDVRILHIL